MVCCKARDETGELDLEELGKRGRSAISLLASLARAASGFLLECGAGSWDKAMSRGIHWRCGREAAAGCTAGGNTERTGFGVEGELKICTKPTCFHSQSAHPLISENQMKSQLTF